MVQKKRIFIYGYGDSQITAANFINKLAKLNLFPVLATQYGEEIYISKQLQPGDFALFISYSGRKYIPFRMYENLKSKRNSNSFGYC